MALNTEQSGATTIRPFHVDVPDETLVELRRRIAASPSENLILGQTSSRSSSTRGSLRVRSRHSVESI